MPGHAPDHIDLGRHRDWQGRTYERWLPNTVFAVVLLLPLAALLNVFGQSPDVRTVANPHGVATMTLSAPTKIRPGDVFEARFDIDAKRDIKNAVLLLDSGWVEAMSLNTIEPGPTSESSRNGQLALTLGKIQAGTRWREYIQMQANPVNAGPQSQGVTLYDGKVPLLRLNRTLMVWP